MSGCKQEAYNANQAKVKISQSMKTGTKFDDVNRNSLGDSNQDMEEDFMNIAGFSPEEARQAVINVRKYEDLYE